MNKLHQMNLISLLRSIKAGDHAKLIKGFSQYKQIIENLEILDVLNITSSDSEMGVELSPLGESILVNDEMLQVLKQQQSMLQTLTNEIQRIKTSLSAISMDVIKSQGLMQDYQSNTGLLSSSDQGVSTGPKNHRKDEIPMKFSSNSISEIKSYLTEYLESISSDELYRQKQNFKLIAKKYKKITVLLQQNDFQELGLELYLIIDAIFIFILNLFNKKDTEIISLSLVKKSQLLQNFPIQVESELIEFLDRFFLDIQMKSDDPLKIGEKTASKLFKLINDLYLSFTNIFEQFRD